MRKNLNKNFKYRYLTIFVALLVLCSFVLSSCTIFQANIQKIAFGDKSLEVIINDVITPQINFFPATTKQTDYILESSDTKVIEVLGKNIKAVGIGSTKLKVVSENEKITSEIDVSVKYADVSQIELVVNGATVVRDTVIASASTSYVVIAKLNNNTDPSVPFTWLIDGQIQSEQEKTLNVATEGIGSTKVTAKVGGISRDINFNVYDPSLQFARTGSALVYMDEGKYNSEIYEIVVENNSSESPPIIYEWLVNNVIQTEISSVFSYQPKVVGELIIVGKANGQTIVQSKIIAKGSIVPKNVMVDFDDTYPDILITWDEIAGFTDFIVKINGIEYSSRDGAIKSRFTTTSFNANNLLDVTNVNEVAVKSLTPNDNYFQDSVFSKVAYSSPIPSSVPKIYLEKFYYGGNRYIEDQAEFNDIIAYTMLYRLSSLTVYIEYSVSYALKEELNTAFLHYSATGSYKFGGQLLGKKVYEISFVYDTANYPTRDKDFTGENANISHLVGVQPHINTDENKYRPSDYVFAIDKVAKTAEKVTKSEELFYTVNLGYRPIVTRGSVAEKIYNDARNVMRTIVTDDMSDFQKVHAIYDWVMWVNTYDYEVIKHTSIEEAVTFKAFYLDGIFNRGSIKPLAVCDGISKAIVLLCRIEGIESIKVGGEVKQNGVSGGHAWNKVRIEGNWYIVDGTWGDGLYSENYSKKFELASHQFMFLNDNSALLENHIQQKVNSYPKATTYYDWFKEEYSFNEVTYDHNITSYTELERFVKIMVEMKKQSGGKPLTKEIKLSGYGVNSSMVILVLRRLKLAETTINLETGDGNICYIIME